jgi:hypothetical protein
MSLEGRRGTGKHFLVSSSKKSSGKEMMKKGIPSLFGRKTKERKKEEGVRKKERRRQTLR